MKSVVVYESMYGNTHHVAEAIAEELRAAGETVVVAVGEATAALAGADLLVVGGPTHAHGTTRAATRRAAVQAAKNRVGGLEVEPGAGGPGLREWFAAVDGLPRASAAFETRIDAPRFFTGRASKGIAKALRKHGSAVVVAPESFLVTKRDTLVDGELDRARSWGEQLARAVR